MYTIVFNEVPEVSDHVNDCVPWSTWSERSCIRLCSLKYLEWVIMYTIVFTEVPEVSDHVYDCVPWRTWSERSLIRLCSLKYLEWVMMYTIVFTEVPEVSDHVYDCVHWRTWSERSCTCKEYRCSLCFCNFAVRPWKCSDSVVFYVFHYSDINCECFPSIYH